MLSDEMITLAIVDNISTETVRKTLKKTNLNRILRKCWVIPPEKNAEFVACMENVLDLYCLAYDPEIPLICIDEQPLQLIKEIKEPLPMQPGEVFKYDSSSSHIPLSTKSEHITILLLSNCSCTFSI